MFLDYRLYNLKYIFGLHNNLKIPFYNNLKIKKCILDYIIYNIFLDYVI